MISTSYKVMAYAHFVVAAMCGFAAFSNLFSYHVTPLTTFNFVLSAINLWLGTSRLEGK